MKATRIRIIGGMILTGERRYNFEIKGLSAVYPPQIPYGLARTGLRIERPESLQGPTLV
jgi:hypothetical protein